MIGEYLGRHGFAVRAAANAAAMDACLAQAMPDLIILDVNLPGEDGFAIARRLRAAGDLPILMLTAADALVDRVVGLELGADDYLTKPFDLRELRARIHSILRRAGRAPGAADQRIRCGDLLLDLDARQLTHADGRAVDLTAMEFDLLAVLARNPNRVLSRERLLTLAHHDDGAVFDRSIDVRIARLRRKIERDPAHPQIVKTMRGTGYMFVLPRP